MKKTLLYSLAAFAAIGLASCSEDYDDWASPQTNAAEDATTYVTYAPGADINCVLPDADSIVHLMTFSIGDGVSSYEAGTVTINGTEIHDTIVGNDICVNSIDLEKAIITANDSRAAVARPIEVSGSVRIKLANGEVLLPTGTATGTVTPQPTPAIDPNGYYMLGNFVGVGWNLPTPLWMTNNGDGTYSADVVTTSTDGSWFKFYEGSKYSSSDWDVVNSGQMGSENDGDDATHNFIVYTGDPLYSGSPQSPKIDGAGKWKITLDMNNLTYTVESTAPEVWYLVGSCIGDGSWHNNGTEDVGVSLYPMAYEGGTKVSYSGYFTTDGFKLIKTPGQWGDQWGESDGNYVKNDGGSGNITVPSAGYYTVTLDYANDQLTIEPMATEPTLYPVMYIAGAFTGSSWPAVEMTACSTSNNHLWKYELSTDADTEGKFLADTGWATNWGATDFPTGVGTQGGPNIPITAGNYTIIFNDITGGYNFVSK